MIPVRLARACDPAAVIEAQPAMRPHDRRECSEIRLVQRGALVLELAKTHEGFVTLEDNVVAGGAGSGVAELLAAENIAMPILHLGLPDAFQHHASREDLLAEAGLDAAGIRDAVLKRWPELSQKQPARSATG